MKAKIYRRFIAGMLAIMLLAAACAPAPAAVAPIPATATRQPTQTNTPPAIQPAQLIPTPGQGEWDLLIISDSSNWGVGKYYARLIEQDLKVKVNLYDCWIGNLSAGQILRYLRTNAIGYSYLGDPSCAKPWQELVREAELLVLFSNPEDSPPPEGPWNVPEADSCMTGSYQGHNTDPNKLATYKANLQKSCVPEVLSTYKADLSDILDMIDQLREGKPLILRMTDFYIPVHTDWQKESVDDVCTACVENFSQAIHQVAEEHGVTVVSTMDSLNGKGHLEDPTLQGYIREDGIHLSDAGAQFVAKVLQQTGYAAWQP